MTEMERMLERVEKDVFGNVCRCCNRPIEYGLTVSDTDADGWPRCNECAPPHKLDEYGCFVWLEEGTLLCAEINDFYKHGTSTEYAVEVTAPETQAFLDAVNTVFGTTFALNQFAGR